MLLNHAARFMARFKLAIENMARFNNVQDGLARLQKYFSIVPKIKYFSIFAYRRKVQVKPSD